jgi:hypothetical protein
LTFFFFLFYFSIFVFVFVSFPPYICVYLCQDLEQCSIAPNARRTCPAEVSENCTADGLEFNDTTCECLPLGVVPPPAQDEGGMSDGAIAGAVVGAVAGAAIVAVIVVVAARAAMSPSSVVTDSMLQPLAAAGGENNPLVSFGFRCAFDCSCVCSSICKYLHLRTCIYLYLCLYLDLFSGRHKIIFRAQWISLIAVHGR